MTGIRPTGWVFYRSHRQEGARAMSHELRLERLFDAPPEVVWDAFVDPNAQTELHGSSQEGWTVSRAETDVSVGGTSVYAMSLEGHEPDIETRVCSVVDRPHRLVFSHSMQIADMGRTFDTEVTLTFEDQGGKTLLTMVQTGFDTEADRDAFMEGWPEYLDTLGRVIGDRQSQTLKAHHDPER
jgi:uncharacterized protein YndB with AHSA1/START domain